MKRIAPLIALSLFILAEAFLKAGIRNSPALQNLLPVVFLAAGAAASVSLCLLIRDSLQTGWSASIWDAFTTPSPQTKWHIALLLVVLLAGTFLRLWHLGSLADGMTYDEAYKGLDGIAIREFHERPVFLEWNGGREALVAYLVAANQKLFDGSIISVRLLTALTGCFTLLVFYLFLKTLFNPNVALLSTFLMAVSKYHIIHSRYGVRAGQFTLFEVAALYFVARGLTSAKKFPWSYVIAGAIAGLGFYTYIAYRIFPAILLSFLIQKDIFAKLRRHAAPIATGVMLAAILVTPAALYYGQHFERFTERMKKTEAWHPTGKNESKSPAKMLLISTANTLGMFTYKGDSIARHNVSFEPMLSPFATAFFLLGIVTAFMNFRKPYAAFLILYLFFGLLPGMLSVDAPNAPRNLASVPPAIVFTAIGILAAVHVISQVTLNGARCFLIVVLGGNLLTGVNDALLRYPQLLDTEPRKISNLWGMDRDPTNVALLLNQIGPRCEVYLTPQLFFHSSVEYLTYGKSKHRLLTPEITFNPPLPEQKVVVVFLQPARANLWWLRDDDEKRFFKWWEQAYGLKTPWIRNLIKESYDRYLTDNSDRRFVQRLRIAFPQGRTVNFDRFTMFVFKP